MLAPMRRAAVARVRGRLTWYAAAAIALLAVAAALRFYELGQLLAHRDEVVAAVNSWGTLAEVVHNTRSNNSAPLLYPLLLWLVQQVDISPFSIRFVPALSGVLTVGVILLLPRLGVRREAALLAAILAALAPAAIYEARGAREYGVDALLAALLIAGLLWYRQSGRKGLLCGALLAAPLLQYGLVLFGIAVIGAGLLLPPSATDGIAKTGPSLWEWTKNWLRRRSGLAWPAAFFLTGCVVSYLTTLRYQLAIVGSGLGKTGRYLQDEYQLIPVLEFTLARIWDVGSHHLPPPAMLAVAGAAALGLLCAGAGRLRRGRNNSAANVGKAGGPGAVIATLFTLALAAAVGAALLGQYPASQARHSTYLGPAVFVFSGVALAAAMQYPARLKSFPAPAPALTIAYAALIIGAGAVALWQYNPYRVAKASDFFGILEQSVQEYDIVYFTSLIHPLMSFYSAYYGPQWPENYIPGISHCTTGYELCIRDLSNAVAQRASGSAIGDVWMIASVGYSRKLIRHDEPGALKFWERFLDSRGKAWVGSLTLSRFPADGGLLAGVRQDWLEEYRPLLAGGPAAPGPFDVYYHAAAALLTYDRMPCAPADTAPPFFLKVFPADPSVLPEPQRSHGVADLDFVFLDQPGALLENRCIVSVSLPDYDIASVHTGQYRGGRSIWQSNIPVLDRFRYVQTAAREPAARAVFNLHLDGNTLLYAKEQCAAHDTDAPFFLHLTPVNPQVLPEPRRSSGFDNRDFKFDHAGVRFDGKCFVQVPLPDYELTGIATGQYAAGRRIWAANLALVDQDWYLAKAATEPAARAVFNLHLDDHSLLYAKDSCSEHDTAAPFFLHLTPADPNALPEPQRQYGFDNRDFTFDSDGMRFDGKCLIRVFLPEYEITGIRTGQYTDAGRIWEVEFAP